MTDNFERLLSKCRSFPFWSHISAQTDGMTNLTTAVHPKTITCTLLLMKTAFDIKWPLPNEEFDINVRTVWILQRPIANKHEERH